MRQLLRQLRCEARAQAGCSAAQPCAPVPRLPEWLSSARYSPRASPTRVVEHRERAELDEVIAAAARAELRPRVVLQSRGHRRHAPVSHPSRRAAPRLERRAHAEARLALERAREPVAARRRARSPADRAPSSSCGTRCPRRRRTESPRFRRQHAADRQPVADVRVRHERARHRDRQRQAFAICFTASGSRPRPRSDRRVALPARTNVTRSRLFIGSSEDAGARRQDVVRIVAELGGGETLPGGCPVMIPPTLGRQGWRVPADTPCRPRRSRDAPVPGSLRAWPRLRQRPQSPAGAGIAA